MKGKKCTLCNITKPLIDFYKCSGRHKSECKLCTVHHIRRTASTKDCRTENGLTDIFRARCRQYYRNNRDRIIERQKQYYREHKEERLAYLREWYKRNPNYQREQYIKKRAMANIMSIVDINTGANDIRPLAPKGSHEKDIQQTPTP